MTALPEVAAFGRVPSIDAVVKATLDRCGPRECLVVLQRDPDGWVEPASRPQYLVFGRYDEAHDLDFYDRGTIFCEDFQFSWEKQSTGEARQDARAQAGAGDAFVLTYVGQSPAPPELGPDQDLSGCVAPDSNPSRTHLLWGERSLRRPPDSAPATTVPFSEGRIPGLLLYPAAHDEAASELAIEVREYIDPQSGERVAFRLTRVVKPA